MRSTLVIHAYVDYACQLPLFYLELVLVLLLVVLSVLGVVHLLSYAVVAQ